MYGPRAVSEQKLAEQAMGSLPRHSMVLGDRNFGVFSVAYAAQQQGLNVVFRLTDVRAAKLTGPICRPGAYPEPMMSSGKPAAGIATATRSCLPKLPWQDD